MKMEQWQRKHITQNLPEVILVTEFNVVVRAELVAKNILCKADIDKLDAVQTQHGKSEATHQYYQLLFGRTDAYKVLVKALMQCSQSGAARILVRVPPELYAKPLTYLDISTKLKNFQDVNIDVHGKTIKIQEFFPAADYERIQNLFQDCLTELEIYDTFVSKERTFVLAKNSVPPKTPYYVPRLLSNRIKIDKSIFRDELSDVFVFKNSIARYKLSEIANPHRTETSSSQLNKITCRFILLDEYEDWTELKKTCTTVPIHLINYDSVGNQFNLEDTSAPSDILRKLDSRDDRVYMSEDDFVQQQLSENSGSTSSVCICDTPGMGKTLLLANTARLMTEKGVGRIIVFISLTAFATDLSAQNSQCCNKTAVNNVLKYISTSPQHENLLLELIQANLLRMGIFFDGFDEVSLDKVEKVNKIFLFINTNFPNVRMYITSRSHMRQELEKSLSVISYDILPFTQQNQLDFLIQFWSANVLNVNQTLLQDFARSCLEAFNKSLSKEDKKITGIPLLCQLIAEIYSDKVALHSIKRRGFWDAPLRISGMYQKFIENKFNLVANNKEELHHFKLAHIWHALNLLFPTNDFHKATLFQNAENLLTSKLLKIGILQKNSNEVLDFMHRTFAEYLVAEYFCAKLQEKKIEEMNCSPMSVLKLLLKIPSTQIGNHFVHPVIVFFFNSALAEINISQKLKIQAAEYIGSILHDEFISILCTCCQNNLLNIFSLMREALANCGCFQIAKIFTDKNSYELLSICIKKSSSLMFHSSIQLLTEVAKLDVAKINTHDNRKSLLVDAVKCANYEAVEYFVDRVSLENQYLLEHCITNNNNIDKRENILNLLLHKDPTLLHEIPDILLTRRLDVRLFKTLVKFGANLNAVDIYHRINCAIHAAEHMSPKDFHELVQFLLDECKATYLFLDNEKWIDPLPKIIRSAILLPETLQMLFNIPGIDNNMKDVYGENLLFSAVQSTNMINFEQLLKLGFDYNVRGWNNRSLLHEAALNGKVEMVRCLLSLKLDANSRDKNDCTPLHYAAFLGGLSAVEVLVENGANVQAENHEGKTALHFCVTNRCEVSKHLIRKGAEINERGNDGNSTLHLCDQRKVKQRQHK